LVSELAFYQQQDIAIIERCVAELVTDPQGRSLAEEILGNARGHLESLDELAKAPAAA
jgi:predicted outer membrane protein